MCGEPHKSLPSGRDNRRKLSRPASRHNTCTCTHLHSSLVCGQALSGCLSLWPHIIDRKKPAASGRGCRLCDGLQAKLALAILVSSVKNKSTTTFREAHRQQSIATPTRPTTGRGAGRTTRWKTPNAKKDCGRACGWSAPRAHTLPASLWTAKFHCGHK
jgi:hypothetical protein